METTRYIALFAKPLKPDTTRDYSYLMNPTVIPGASEHRERATRSERAGAAARESACRGVRGAKPLG
jgi:hypothetical protein